MTLNSDYINTEEIDDFRRTICDKIRAMRISKGMTQGDLAEAVGIGRSHICRIESGKFNFSLSHLLYIMKVLGIESIDILKPGEQMKTKKRGRKKAEPNTKDFSVFIGNLDQSIDALEKDRIQYIDTCASEAFKTMCVNNPDGAIGYKHMMDSVKEMAKYKSVDIYNYLTSLSEKQLKGAVDGVTDEYSSGYATEMLNRLKSAE